VLENQAYVGLTVDHRWTDLLKVILNNLRTAPYRPRGHHHSHEMEVSRGRDACEQKRGQISMVRLGRPVPTVLLASLHHPSYQELLDDFDSTEGW
jgi:hypothetical protein